MSGHADLSNPAIRLLHDLVSIPSVSGNERTASEFLAAEMARRGLSSFVDDVNNAIGFIGEESSEGRTTDIVLLGHIDTFPGEVPVRIENGRLYGRGTVDAKGPLCSFVEAAARAKLPRGVRLVVVGAVEEEVASSLGARTVAAMLRPAACIIGEPSGWDAVTLGYKGRLLAEFRCRREITHTAGPHASAADIACHWWEQVRTQAQSLRTSTRAFDVVQATLRRINSSADGLCEESVALASFRLPTGITPSQIEQICRTALPEGATVTFSGAEVAHVADRSNAVVRALSGGIRDLGATPHPKLKTGTCDLNVVGPVWNCPIAAYGAGDSTLDHTPSEHVPLDEYLKSIDVLVRAIEGLAAELVNIHGG